MMEGVPPSQGTQGAKEAGDLERIAVGPVYYLDVRNLEKRRAPGCAAARRKGYRPSLCLRADVQKWLEISLVSPCLVCPPVRPAE